MAKFGLRASAFSCSTTASPALRVMPYTNPSARCAHASSLSRTTAFCAASSARANAIPSDFHPYKTSKPHHICKQRVGLRIRRIKLNCSFQQLPSHRVVVLRARIDTGKRTHDTLPGVQAFRRLALCPYALSGVKLRLDRGHHPFGYLVLKRKDRGELAVITFGPHMMPGDGINELRGDTHPVRCLANAAFQRIAHT